MSPAGARARALFRPCSREALLTSSLAGRRGRTVPSRRTRACRCLAGLRRGLRRSGGRRRRSRHTRRRRRVRRRWLAWRSGLARRLSRTRWSSSARWRRISRLRALHRRRLSRRCRSIRAYDALLHLRARRPREGRSHLYLRCILKGDRWGCLHRPRGLVSHGSCRGALHLGRLAEPATLRRCRTAGKSPRKDFNKG